MHGIGFQLTELCRVYRVAAYAYSVLEHSAAPSSEHCQHIMYVVFIFSVCLSCDVLKCESVRLFLLG